MEGEEKAAFSGRQPRKHFRAQINIQMYNFVHEIRAQRAPFNKLRTGNAERRQEVLSLCASRSALSVFLFNRLALLFH
jgi:hypothetical protein